MKSNWQRISYEIHERHKLLFEARDRISRLSLDETTSLRLAATDVFVEKAQRRLTMRGAGLLVAGGILTASAVAIVAVTVSALLRVDPPSNPDPLQFTLLILRGLAVSAMILGIAVLLAGLARACFHEGLTHFNRRHALRFGRLYVYLNNRNITFKELSKAFQWNREFISAFKDIRPELLSNTLLHKLVDTIPAMFDTAVAGTKAVKNSRTDPTHKDQQRST